MTDLQRINSITELHELLGLGKPLHPSISLVHTKDITLSEKLFNHRYVWDFYMISLKFEDCAVHYGRQYYDFAEGSLIFTSPGQVFEAKNQPSSVSEHSWALYFHPDLLRRTGLGTKVNSYGFFSYAFHEALHLSERERAKIVRCIEAIEEECQQHIDPHSQTVIVANLELLLYYCNRFYDRQFYTRSPHQGEVVAKVEALLLDYFSSVKGLRHGIPTVKFCAEHVNLSPNYLSDLLKKETGRNTQEHIHYHLIERAKNALLASDEPVSAIAYDLGFEHPQSFGALFKKKVGVPPSRFRQLN